MSSTSPPPSTTIDIEGARLHNLKSVSCRIPHGQLTVITGPSGCGKSSLAFDTLYAEGQRRYLESLSPYVRQFLERVEKPEVDRIDNILPAIALQQHNSTKNARSTVGTATDVQDYLQLLFGHLGQVQCDQCGSHQVGELQAETIVAQVSGWPEGTRLMVLASVDLNQHLLADLVRLGFYRYWHKGSLATVTATTLATDLPADIQAAGRLPLMIDRLTLITADKGVTNRLNEAIAQAMALSGDDTVTLQPLPAAAAQSKEPPPEPTTYQTGYCCYQCGKRHEPPSPARFSFNTPLGACPTCEGFGRVIGLDPTRIVPNPKLTLKQGALHPFQTPANSELQDLLEYEAPRYDVPLNVPYAQLSESQRQKVWNGMGSYEGVRGFFAYLETKRYKMHVRILLARYRGYYDCPDCQGARIKKEALNVLVADRPYLQWVRTPLQEVLAWVVALADTVNGNAMAEPIVADVRARLQYLVDVGLGYLTLSRTMRTLSGGEAQRIHLAGALGTALTETLYVLDEPTVGLHSRDTARLLGAIFRLRDLGNTVVVVEHDPDVMLAADHLLDIGPGSGEDGGRIVYEGTVAGLMETPYSLTAQWLAQRNNPLPHRDTTNPPPTTPPVVIHHATGHNLKDVTVSIPTGQLVTITGVSGSGKSTLIRYTLYGHYLLSQGELPSFDPTPCAAIEGLEQFGEVVLVDQSPPGRSVRSNPVTYLKAFDEIRALFAQTVKAQSLGLTAGDFSFNSAGGRCDTCEGLGFITVDMQFMADVSMNCPDCDGQRFTPSVLSVEVDGRTIDEVLNLSVNEAMACFKTVPALVRKLAPLQELGLGYLKLGQSTSTLSGGEAQRLKLATHLPPKGKPVKKPCLFIFDEPTTGLHLADVAVLSAALRRMVSAGHSVIVIEHHTDFIAMSDYVIDLGPEGGDGGGQVVYTGSPMLQPA